MTKEWISSALIDALAGAGKKGMTKSTLEKKIPKAVRHKSTLILSELRSTGSIHGPFKKRSDYYFAPEFAPTRAQAEGLIENLLRDAGPKLTTKTDLGARANVFLQIFFKDALAALKSEARIIELKRGPSTFYVHREAVLEQLRLSDESEAGPNRDPAPSSGRTAVTFEDVRLIYERLKAEQGGISAVKIYDIMTRLGAAKQDLHGLLLHEAKSGRVSLHRASSAKFPSEVIEAGIRLERHSEPLVTIVLKEEP
jgi:hypothetical protein